MHEARARPRIGTILATLKACTKHKDLVAGEKIHKDLINNGDAFNVFVANTLVDMYAKCGSMLKAFQVFEDMPYHSLVSWNCIILGYAQCGQGDRALELFKEMQDEGFEPDAVSFVAAMKACSSLVETQAIERGLEFGKAMHSKAIERKLDLNIYVASSLVDMYCRFGEIVQARQVFDKMQLQNVILWNSIISGYALNGEHRLVLEMFSYMQQNGFQPDVITLATVVKTFGNLAELENGKLASICLAKGRYLHVQAFQSGCELDLMVANTLVDMYGKCKSMAESRRLFERMPHRNAVSWNCLMMGYVEAGEGMLALELYGRMDCTPNNVTFVAALKACASLADEACEWSLEQGKAIHLHAIKNEFDMDMFVASTLVDMYAKCRNVAEAYQVFIRMPRKDVVSWNCIIVGYVQNQEPELALDLYDTMQEMGFIPNDLTLQAALKACIQLSQKEVHANGSLVKTRSLRRGSYVHFQAAKYGHLSNVLVANSVLHMYTKCGSMVDARKMFESMKERNATSWTHLIWGYAENGEGKHGLEMYDLMQMGPCLPDAVIFVAASKACAAAADQEQAKLVDGILVKVESLEIGKSIHAQAAKWGFELEMFVASSLVDTYAKCGSMKDARSLFERMHTTSDAVPWNCLIMGYIQEGDCEEALKVFALMKDQRVVPTYGTYLAALKASGSLAALETGREIHCEICNAGLDSNASVVCSLIDFYGKCGSMGEAQQFFDFITKDDLAIWNSLIIGYSRHGATSEVFELFSKIQDKYRPDDITFLAVLTACSYAGLVVQGCQYFELMLESGVVPQLEHYACMVDLLGRANQLEDAVVMLKRVHANEIQLWMTLLGAAWKWKNVEVSKVAFEGVVRNGSVDNSAAFVCLSNMYADTDII